MSASQSHCSCCHSCHVSMKQRPRPLLACSQCNNIYCRICLQTRWKSDKWEEGLAMDPWVCPKCTGDCVCKSCAKGQHKSVVKKRAHPSSAAPAATSVAVKGGEDQQWFDAPQVRSKRHSSTPQILPGRQPSLPDGFQPTPKATPSVQIPYDRDSAGLAMLLRDANTPVHRKTLELARAKEHCDATIKNMENLLKMLQEERKVIDTALNELIHETTISITTNNNFLRTASMAQFEELYLHSPNKAGMPKSGSQCNLDELEA